MEPPHNCTTGPSPAPGRPRHKLYRQPTGGQFKDLRRLPLESSNSTESPCAEKVADGQSSFRRPKHDAFSQFDWKPLLGNRDRRTEGIPRARPLTHGRGTSSVPRNTAASGGGLLDIDWGSQHIAFRALYLLGSPGVGSRGPYTYPAPRLVSRDSASDMSGLSSLYGHYEPRRLSRVALRLQLQPGDNQGTGPDLVDLAYKLNIDVPSLSQEGWDAIRSKMLEKLNISDKSAYLNNLPTTHAPGPKPWPAIRTNISATQLTQLPDLSIVSGMAMEVMEAMQEMTRALQRHRDEYNAALPTAAQSHNAVGGAASLGMYQRPALRSWTSYLSASCWRAGSTQETRRPSGIVPRRSITPKMRTLINVKTRMTGAGRAHQTRDPEVKIPAAPGVLCATSSIGTRIDIMYTQMTLGNADTFFVISFTEFKDEAILPFEG
ncbi:hypothetical protein CSOJ01_06564 [Colletotrichum sojae]|uniref:Uncharacterized protein n=1 Tax=Colletotrichum sojae TaxID=2175907 RepID=A0A8H6JCA6_9PEZI|nr:hypothetical protein CSOJ01_06564 [Colletotrichum sojae]